MNICLIIFLNVVSYSFLCLIDWIISEFHLWFPERFSELNKTWILSVFSILSNMILFVGELIIEKVTSNFSFFSQSERTNYYNNLLIYLYIKHIPFSFWVLTYLQKSLIECLDLPVSVWNLWKQTLSLVYICSFMPSVFCFVQEFFKFTCHVYFLWTLDSFDYRKKKWQFPSVFIFLFISRNLILISL